jgi:enoyl-CoA hydratase/carnithine racemase
MPEPEEQSPSVTYAVADGVATVTLARPKYRNAQSVRLVRELDAALRRAREDDAVRVIVLAGEGGSFSAGHDLGSPEDVDEVEFRRTAPTRAVGARSFDLYSELTMTWRDLPKPTIAAVQGYCVYAGWSIASAMDIVIAADDAQFLPHLSEFFTLPWVIGPRRAKQVLFANRPLSAERALEFGMVAEVVPADQLAARARELALQIAANDPALVRLIKGAVNNVEDTMGFAATIRTSQAYNVLGYHGVQGSAAAEGEDATAAEGKRIGLVGEALDAPEGGDRND